MYTDYCDRRWFHLRVMGHIHSAKKTLRQEGARMRAQYPDAEGERWYKEHEREVRWLNTYFVDEITVVSPRGFPNREETSKRPWDNPNWIKHVEKLQNGFDRERANMAEQKQQSLRNR